MPWKRWTRNGGAKLLSFVIAGGLWFTVTNRIEFEDTVDFPIEYVNRPEGLSTIEPLPERVRTRVHGKGKFLRYRTHDGVCRVDLSGQRIGQARITFAGEDVVLPEDVEVSRIEILEPKRVTVEFDETVERDVAIVPAVVGTPDPRYVQVGRTFLNTSRAHVKGPRRLVDEIALVHTREINIDGKKGTVRKQVRLVPPDSPTVEITPMNVDVGITIEPIVSERLDKVLLRASGTMPAGSSAHFDPPEIAMEIEGAKPIAEVAAKQESLELTVHADRWVQGGRSVLLVKEIRGAEIRFEARAVEATDVGDVEIVEEREPAARGRASGPPEPAEATGGPAAVRGEIVAKIPLPTDLEIVGIEPDRIVVYVGAADSSGSMP